jgi:arsenite transporter
VYRRFPINIPAGPDGTSCAEVPMSESTVGHSAAETAPPPSDADVGAGGSSGGLGTFERLLSLWVALAIVAGVALGQLAPAVPEVLSRFEYAQVSLPVAVLIWAMIFPMMVQIDFGAIVGAGREPRGLLVTTGINWLVKPFTMFAIAYVFLLVIFAPLIPEELGRQYLAGAILLGAAPCTAMVFVWSYLTRGDAGYTLVQVAVNDLIMLVAFAPIVLLLLGVSDIAVPWDTVALSVVLYIVIPLAAGWLTRVALIKRRGIEWFDGVFMRRIAPVTPTGLVITLVLLFAFQGEVILANPLHIGLIAVPLIIQTVLIFYLAYRAMQLLKVRHAIAAPGAMIGASNFFELAVAAAIALFGLQSPAALATVVGVLVEVPLMLALVRYANRTRHRFPSPAVATETRASG